MMAAQLVLQGEAGVELRLAADFEAEVERLAGVEDFLHHFAQLVHLDRKHAAILALEIIFGDGILEGLVDGLHAMAQDVLKADEQRELQAAALRLFQHVGEVHTGARLLQRRGGDVPGFVDVEILRTPARNVVKRAGIFDAPGRRVVSCVAHLNWFKRANYKKPAPEINQCHEKSLGRRPAPARDFWRWEAEIRPSGCRTGPIQAGLIELF